ncbi:MAG: sulfate ABC transporter substrate-binding protein [Verrucomicrobia bacterium]|nr:sulfate ABC transporter substrate-binding protein [Verrucomicrobiota bacterium]
MVDIFPSPKNQLASRGWRRICALLASAVLLAPAAGRAQNNKSNQLLNVSYDVARDFYREFNPAFAKTWQAQTGQEPTINMSHGGSSAQVRAVLDGLEADVVTMNQETDITALVKGGLVAPSWRTRLPEHAAPYSSTILFLVRKGNPKGIKDWNDLIKPGVGLIIPNPKTSGNGRYTYLAAWAYALQTNGNNEKAARDFVAKLFKNVPVLDTGGRAATTTFAQRGVGDVLLTFECETSLIKADPALGGDKLDVVVPSRSILAEAPVSVVDKNVDKHGSRALAEAYLKYLFSDEGQELAAQKYYRPRNAAAAAKYASRFPALTLFTIDEVFGGWDQAQKTHFDDGGVFDQIYQP